MIKITKDYQMIKEMLFKDDELYNRISDDFSNQNNFKPEKFCWFGWFEDGDCKGLLQVHKENEVTLIVHINIPKNHRGKGQSFKIGKGLLDFMIAHCHKKVKKINAKIPVCFPDVARFAEKCGFSKEGIDRQSYLKNNKYYDRVCFGKVIR